MSIQFSIRVFDVDFQIRPAPDVKVFDGDEQFEIRWREKVIAYHPATPPHELPAVVAKAVVMAFCVAVEGRRPDDRDESGLPIMDYQQTRALCMERHNQIAKERADLAARCYELYRGGVRVVDIADEVHKSAGFVSVLIRRHRTAIGEPVERRVAIRLKRRSTGQYLRGHQRMRIGEQLAQAIDAGKALVDVAIEFNMTAALVKNYVRDYRESMKFEDEPVMA